VNRATESRRHQPLCWLAADQHGTSSLALDATTQAVTKRYTTPFGAPRTGGAGTWPDDKTFLGKTTDSSSGLTYIGAREYDPTTGRFLSVDPLLTTDQSQSLNGYTYANNNPTTSSDPTGLESCCPAYCSGDHGTYGNKLPIPAPKSGGTASTNSTGDVSGRGAKPAVAPDVQSTELKNILGDIYLKPGSVPQVGDGKVGSALINELETGNQTKGLWHVADAADQLIRITKLLERDRKGEISLSEGDRRVALDEAKQLWDALDTKDQARAVTKLMREVPKVASSVRKAGTRALRAPSMSSVTGGITRKSRTGRLV
jgi:RHS repeat-associated protein